MIATKSREVEIVLTTQEVSMQNKNSNLYVVFLIVIIGCLISPLPESNLLNADIRNTHHDFSNATWSTGEICKHCHIPHNSISGITPLWNHQLSSGSSYQAYTSSTMNSTPAGSPLGSSKLCLSCHDGTIAIENHSGTTTGIRFTSWGNVGTDMRNDHPISFVYDPSIAIEDGELHDPTATPSGLGKTISEDLLENGRMECSTCHDVHVARKTSSGCGGCHSPHGSSLTRQTLSLRVNNTGSAFCLTCHNK